MPELPDILAYLDALAPRTLGRALEKVQVIGPFLLRTVDPPLSAAEGRRVEGLRRLGKRIVFALEDGLFLVLHLMIAGRLHWREAGVKVPGKIGLAAFRFAEGTLLLTEASSKKRASLHVVRGETALAALDPGGLEVLACDPAAFAAALRRENHTLKRVLTDPRVLSGIGNAYSDEILHRARLSPVLQTRRMTAAQAETLLAACRETLAEWIDRLRRETGSGFPAGVTAFREGMAVHGRYRKPCPVCGAPVQRIATADHETNYCPRCQTGGKILADRSLSRLLKDDWPKTLEELDLAVEERRVRRGR